MWVKNKMMDFVLRKNIQSSFYFTYFVLVMMMYIKNVIWIEWQMQKYMSL